MADEFKRFQLRIPERLHRILSQWATVEHRSLHAQILVVLEDTIRGELEERMHQLSHEHSLEAIMHDLPPLPEQASPNEDGPSPEEMRSYQARANWINQPERMMAFIRDRSKKK